MAAATVALGAIAILQPVGLPLIGSLVLLGAGLGAFTPVNNTSVMSAAPRTASGVAAGLLNMTRGLGTSLGAAIALLVYELSGFSWAVAALAVAALLAAILSAAPRIWRA
jgi:MFS family permease